MTPDFAAGAFRLGKKLKELLVTAALEAFGDVGHYGNARPLDLTPQPGVARESRSRRGVVDRPIKLPRGFPNLKILEPFDASHAESLRWFRVRCLTLDVRP